MNKDTKWLEPAKDVLKDWYGMTIPDAFLLDILSKDEELTMEVETGGISDTCQRSILADAVLKKIGMRPWPVYGEGNKVFEQFIIELKEKIKEIGGEAPIMLLE